MAKKCLASTDMQVLLRITDVLNLLFCRPRFIDDCRKAIHEVEPVECRLFQFQDLSAGKPRFFRAERLFDCGVSRRGEIVGTVDEFPTKAKALIRNVMAVIFNCAMRWGFIDRGTNPVSLVRVKGVSRRQKEPRILNAAEIQNLNAKLEDPCRTAVVVALGTGLRCSELFALKWEDINWEELSLSVRRAIVDGVVGDVKTKYSESRLPLDPALAEVLFNWKRKTLFAQNHDWVFASAQKAGELPLRSHKMLARQIKPAAAAAQIGTEIGWHTFRHTYSSMLRQLG